MPVTPTYPGVYVEEIPSGVRTITGVATSITAFVGYTQRGLDHRAKRILSFADFERSFGGLAADSELSYAVQHFFANGGGEAFVVRVPKSADASVPAADRSAAASITLLDNIAGGAKPALELTALSRGSWANNVVIDVDYDGIPADDTKAFNLTITDLSSGTVETFSDVTMDSTRSNYIESVVNDPDRGSQMISVRVPAFAPGNEPGRPAASGTIGGDVVLSEFKNDKEYTIKVTSDLPPSNTELQEVEFPFLSVGETIPGSILGACRLLERKLNAALQQNLPGARARCLPSGNGKGIRVVAGFDQDRLPNTLDASLTFSAGSTDSALAMLKLGATDPGGNAKSNVAHYWLGRGRTILAQQNAVAGADGRKLPTAAELIGNASKFTGIYALEKVDLFNLLCIPDVTRGKVSDSNQSDLESTEQNAVLSAAITLCAEHHAFLLIDPPPEVNDVDSAAEWKASSLAVHDKHGAAYFPRLRMPDPLNGFQLRTFAPCGALAGLYARIDATRGVWKAPAGVEANLVGVQGQVYKLSDRENGVLNPLGLNCLRTFPVYGHVAWGARTLVGADAEASEWKYIPVRRLALFLEESLERGTKWVVFEPNDEPLWAQIRLNIGAFMHNLFRQGAFQGKTPREAYLVKCDRETTTQDDINRGIVNIVVGFAPLKPAEFVIIKIQQLAGQIET